MTREEAITALGDRNNLLWGMSKEEKKHYSEALDMAISALSADVRPNIHGEWIYQEGVTPYKWRCNKCEKVFKTDFNFCPNCGADMRGEE